MTTWTQFPLGIFWRFTYKYLLMASSSISKNYPKRQKIIKKHLVKANSWCFCFVQRRNSTSGAMKIIANSFPWCQEGTKNNLCSKFWFLTFWKKARHFPKGSESKTTIFLEITWKMSFFLWCDLQEVNWTWKLTKFLKNHHFLVIRVHKSDLMALVPWHVVDCYFWGNGDVLPWWGRSLHVWNISSKHSIKFGKKSFFNKLDIWISFAEVQTWYINHFPKGYQIIKDSKPSAHKIVHCIMQNTYFTRNTLKKIFLCASKTRSEAILSSRICLSMRDSNCVLLKLKNVEHPGIQFELSLPHWY